MHKLSSIVAGMEMLPTESPSITLEERLSKPVLYEHPMKETLGSANNRDAVYMYDGAMQGKHT